MIGATNAGYTVTTAAQVAPDWAVVLAEDKKQGTYVTWLYNENFQSFGDGYYTTSHRKALASFCRRVENKLGLDLGRELDVILRPVLYSK